MLPSSLSRNIRDAREALGLSRRQAATAAGISQPEWSRYESGDRLPTLRRLAAIAAALGIDLADLLIGVDADSLAN